MMALLLSFRFELDMLLESVSSTAKRAEELLNSINENKITLETPFHLKDHFSGMYIYLIQEVYYIPLARVIISFLDSDSFLLPTLQL